MFEGNLAFKMPEQEPYEVEIDSKQELRDLRKKQLAGDISEEERARIVTLQEQEAIKEGQSSSESEKARFVELTKKQMSGTIESGESDELAQLFRKIEGK